jgi:inner membrane protein
MPSLLGHAVAGLAITESFSRAKLPRRTWVLAPLCAVAPDLDWFLSFLNIHKNHIMNHRGVAHSLFGALLLAAAILLVTYRRHQRSGQLWLCLSLAALSHGIMDACTSGGVGVALFMPFSDSRWVCVWRPIRVAPLPMGREDCYLFLASLLTEAIWIGLPALALILWSRLRRKLALVPSLADPLPELEKVGA